MKTKLFLYIVLIFLVVCVATWIYISIDFDDKPEEKEIHEKKIQESKEKINQHEKDIHNDSVVIWNSDREFRDSIRAILNPE